MRSLLNNSDVEMPISGGRSINTRHEHTPVSVSGYHDTDNLIKDIH